MRRALSPGCWVRSGSHAPGDWIGLWLTFTYFWLPFMILPIYAGIERIPSSLLEASGDLGARSVRTFWRVTLPLAFPAVVAGSIFTFSLTLGDYILPTLIADQQFIGTVIYGVAARTCRWRQRSRWCRSRS